MNKRRKTNDDLLATKVKMAALGDHINCQKLSKFFLDEIEDDTVAMERELNDLLPLLEGKVEELEELQKAELEKMKASKASKSVDLSAKLKQIMSKSEANDRHYAA